MNKYQFLSNDGNDGTYIKDFKTDSEAFIYCTESSDDYASLPEIQKFINGSWKEWDSTNEQWV